eukprot:6195219-Pleurochrysis_carterae.AAC.2
MYQTWLALTPNCHAPATLPLSTAKPCRQKLVITDKAGYFRSTGLYRAGTKTKSPLDHSAAMRSGYQLKNAKKPRNDA